MRILILILSISTLAFLANSLAGAGAVLLGHPSGWTRIFWSLPAGLLCGVLAFYLTKKYQHLFFK